MTLNRPRPDHGSDSLMVSPIGDIPPWISQLLAERLSEVFGLPAQVVPVLEDLSFAYDQGRNQFHSTPVLDRLAAACPDQGLKILGMTKEDLFIPILTHVYGEAQLGGRACIISVSRLLRDIPGPETGRDRVVKEAVHELGHCFDLRHCKDPSCVMHYCRKLSDVDRKTLQFCRYCRVLLNDQFAAAGL